MQQTQTIERVAISDSSSLIRLQLSELVYLETLRVHFPDTIRTATRTIFLNQTLRDTLLSTSIALRSDSASGHTEIVHTSPLTVQSNKGGQQGFAPSVLWPVLIFLAIFLLCWYFVKKK